MSKKSTMEVHMNKNTGTFLVLLLILAIGIGLSIWGVLDINKTNYYKDHAVDITGYVVDYDRTTDEDNDDIYYAIYEYHVDGVTYTVKDTDYSYSRPTKGEKHVVYYNPQNPAEAITDLDGGLGAILLVIGLIFGLTGLAFLMAWMNVNESVIRIVLGAMMVLMGFAVPIVVRSWFLFLFTAIFGVLGVVIVIKAVTKLTGNEGGVIDQVLDDGMEQAAEVIQNVAEKVESGTDEHAAQMLYISSIIKGILVIVPGSIIGLFGLFMLLTASPFMGIFMLGFGGFLIYLGAKEIKHGLEIRAEAKKIEETYN